ncbi:hypothetical protein [Actinomyces urinae]|uniref:hypothetical protein n=1 Tax=Actinomyces urinae TaxID=1689268 RepID=UPI0012B67B8E|nr:hypothetical protein [Actinomyces urinae]
MEAVGRGCGFKVGEAATERLRRAGSTGVREVDERRFGAYEGGVCSRDRFDAGA